MSATRVPSPLRPNTVRPFRLWDTKLKRNVPRRYYATERRALDSALVLIRWSHVGESIDVYDARVSNWIATYTRKVNTIQFTK